jgi:CheY-like chemotaxis protein
MISTPSEITGVAIAKPLHDPVRLSQAISNLQDNAAKYTPPQGEIYLIADREGDQAVIRVRDNGNRIEPELLPHVFEPFVQGSRSPDRAKGGLGLNLVRSIVEMHSGRVEAHSEGLGHGSEVRIWLPLLPKTDDLLGIEGHEAVVANSGPQAIELASKHVPEVALIDIRMPGTDGYEVARRMRTSPELNHMALVAVAGYGHEEDIQLSPAGGAYLETHAAAPGSESRGLYRPYQVWEIPRCSHYPGLQALD